MKIENYNLSKKISVNTAWDKLMANPLSSFIKTPQMETMWQVCQREGQRLRNEYSYLVVFGIGGSGLISKVFADLWDKDSKLFLVDNSDPDLVARTLAWIGSKPKGSVSYLLISKSGTTVETLFAFECVIHKFPELVKAGLVITDYNNNELFKWAKSHHVNTLEIPGKVGGRFSALTPVGLIPAVFLGQDILEIKKGAEIALLDSKLAKDIASSAIESFSHQKWITLFLIYSSSLKSFGDWINQLWAESLGKLQLSNGQEGAPRVSTPLVAKGSTDHHSLLQQFLEGQQDKWYVFINVEQFAETVECPPNFVFTPLKQLIGKPAQSLIQAQSRACIEALVEKNNPVTELKIGNLSAATVGQLIMLFELVVGLIGEHHGINTYDQPAVERVKVLTRQRLSQMV